MNIAIGADHRGLKHKEFIKKHLDLVGQDIEWIDVGTFDEHRTDYPIFAKAVCKTILKKEASFGILICGSGVGMAMTANRFKEIYAAVAWNEESARIGREHDKSNVLVIPADFVSVDVAIAMIKAWMHAGFKGDRYQKRIEMIDEIEEA